MPGLARFLATSAPAAQGFNGGLGIVLPAYFGLLEQTRVSALLWAIAGVAYGAHRDTEHYAHLLVHGTLHAQDWDHETSEADAEEMQAYESDILRELGFADPYGK